ncbi:hypothetical protein [Rhodobacter calidifons]|uniref:Uncharacterized protein n=1 Tax=Rhodobacter calidifons TaxID=2715277 RepID=A0ABX0GCG8_9RHOB|nr:hypothetical protein [Rhodobacter calidifons]NHB78577.1 hypothetical protein [Rhodobacter calidifons]
MITFEGDERFADVEYVGVTYESTGRVLRLLVTSDPADNCETILLRDVAAFDVLHFTRQNVVSYLDIARLAAAEHHAFVELAVGEGAIISLTTSPSPNALLGVVFVSANGATIFALCASVEKCSSDGQPIYRVVA